MTAQDIDREVANTLAKHERRQRQRAQAAETVEDREFKMLSRVYAKADLVHLRSAAHEIREFPC
jgi:hypothetical protein